MFLFRVSLFYFVSKGLSSTMAVAPGCLFGAINFPVQLRASAIRGRVNPLASLGVERKSLPHPVVTGTLFCPPDLSDGDSVMK